MAKRSPGRSRHRPALWLLAVALGVLAGCGHAGPAPVPAPPAPSTSPSVSPSLPPPSGAPGLTLRLLTYNVWGKPGVLGTDLKERVERLPEVLKGYDAVVLQESFAAETANLAERSGYAYWYRPANGSLGRLNSGVYIMSRFPIAETRFKEFSRCTVFDCFAAKGVAMARLSLPDGRTLDLYGTHYQAEDKGAAIRVQDNLETASFVRANDAGHPTVLLGDLNFHETTGEYRDLMARLQGTVDVFRRLHPDDPGYTWDPKRNPNVPRNEPFYRYDYALLLPPDRGLQPVAAEIVGTGPVRGFYLSDHFGLSVTLRLK